MATGSTNLFFVSCLDEITVLSAPGSHVITCQGIGSVQGDDIVPDSLPVIMFLKSLLDHDHHVLRLDCV